MNVCVFSGIGNGDESPSIPGRERIGLIPLAKAAINLVYGGGNIGLPGDCRRCSDETIIF